MHIGRHHFRFEEIDSTNSRALEYANDSDLDGAVFQSLVQTAGRGQYGRAWHANPGDAILLSVLLFPPVVLRRPVLLTAMAAVAVCETIANATGLQARIKWPNDVLIDGRKVCGILIESRVNRDGGLAVVCGIGLNLNQTEADFDRSGLPHASSLRILQSDRRFDVEIFTTDILRHLDLEYDRLCRGEIAGLEDCWQRRIGLLQRPVRIAFMDGQGQTGLLIDMTFDEILLRDGVGTLHRLPPETIRHITETAS